jgi:hypothetical protein
MMKNIITIVVVVILLYLFYQHFFADNSVADLASMHNGKQSREITSDKLPSGAGTNDFTYSFWFYVNSWSYNYGKRKIIMARYAKEGNNEHPMPMISFGASSNDLEITLTGKGAGSAAPSICNIKNVPIQKWTHVVVTLMDKTIDVYLDGKLVKTCLMGDTPFVDGVSNSSLYLCPKDLPSDPHGGFSGFLSKFRFYARSVPPREAYELYRQGFSDSWGGSAMSKFNLKFAFLKDDSEVAALQI